MGYKGVVISDDLEMKALAQYQPSARALAALNAGIDVLLVGNSESRAPLEIAYEMAVELDKAQKSGELTNSVLLESSTRIDKLLAHLEKIKKNSPQASLASLGCSDHRALCEKIVPN